MELEGQLRTAKGMVGSLQNDVMELVRERDTAKGSNVVSPPSSLGHMT